MSFLLLGQKTIEYSFNAYLQISPNAYAYIAKLAFYFIIIY